MRGKGINMQVRMNARQDAIRLLLANRQVSDQHELVGLLKKNYDIATTQAAVSRDLKALGVSKGIKQGIRCYQLKNNDPQKEMLEKAVIDVRHNETTIVVRTQTGLADFVGDSLDSDTTLPLLGTIAGENIVIAIPTTIATIEKTAEMIKISLGKSND